jgi:hypothetical protein
MDIFVDKTKNNYQCQYCSYESDSLKQYANHIVHHYTENNGFCVIVLDNKTKTQIRFVFALDNKNNISEIHYNDERNVDIARLVWTPSFMLSLASNINNEIIIQGFFPFDDKMINGLEKSDVLTFFQNFRTSKTYATTHGMLMGPHRKHHLYVTFMRFLSSKKFMENEPISRQFAVSITDDEYDAVIMAPDRTDIDGYPRVMTSFEVVLYFDSIPNPINYDETKLINFRNAISKLKSQMTDYLTDRIADTLNNENDRVDSFVEQMAKMVKEGLDTNNSVSNYNQNYEKIVSELESKFNTKEETTPVKAPIPEATLANKRHSSEKKRREDFYRRAQEAAKEKQKQERMKALKKKQKKLQKQLTSSSSTTDGNNKKRKRENDDDDDYDSDGNPVKGARNN